MAKMKHKYFYNSKSQKEPMGISRQQKGCLLHNGKTGKFRLAEIALRRHPSANIPQTGHAFRLAVHEKIPTGEKAQKR